MKKIVLLITLLLVGFSILAQQKPDFRWLAGTWRGPGFGGSFEEVWSEPDANGKLMGMFRFLDERGNLQFYEFWILDETGLKLKHFNPDFTGWEEKGDFIHFKMVTVEPNKVILKGLIYELLPNGTLKISLDLKNGDEVRTEVFELKRVE